MFNKKGFTLVELLVALSLMAVVGGVIVATFSGGAGVWERVQCQGTQEQNLLISFEEIKKSFHNMKPFKPIPFVGKLESFSFPTLLSNPYEPNSDLLEPGQ